MERVIWLRFCFLYLTHTHNMRVLTGRCARLKVTSPCIPLVHHLWGLIYDLVMDTENVSKWDRAPLKEHSGTNHSWETKAEWDNLTTMSSSLSPLQWLSETGHLQSSVYICVCVRPCGCVFVIYSLRLCLGVQHWDRGGCLCLDWGSSLFWQQALTASNWFPFPCLSKLLQKKQF